ncbi:hypothetical protein EIN_162490 [Entamoeba invadens IP1]|uniref:Uncharacterized protein n=1 Tax=Entamoeba invadens IP1 TaxID=370355 RepID=A0A0A1U4H7_ENTIV|nr:hypothetical protein EIN_162490 [Entamoeba invadens IP1]ELP86605.1 hypothetical protein EIN_162490 [Entamoeba invadens IP1]|eukprot:XP_004185951.1 hypothetical protein EIN_162490 [Entamoeba invadens IP1]
MMKGYTFKPIPLFSNNKALTDTIAKNDIKQIIFTPPSVLIRLDNDCILTFKSNGALLRLDQLTTATKFVLFDKQHGVVIRSGEDKRLVFNILANDQIFSAQSKIILNIPFKKTDELFVYHHPTDFVIFISFKESQVIYRINYNIVYLNTLGDECDRTQMCTFKVISEPPVEILVSGPILHLKKLGSSLVALKIVSKDKSNYSVYDMALNVLQDIPFIHNSHQIYLLQRYNDLVAIQPNGDVYILNTTFALPMPIKIDCKFNLPNERFSLFVDNDVIITLTHDLVSYFSLKTKSAIGQTKIEGKFNPSTIIPWRNETNLGLYDTTNHFFYQIVPTTKVLVISSKKIPMIEAIDASFAETLKKLWKVPRHFVDTFLSEMQSVTLFMCLPREKHFVDLTVDRMKKEKMTYTCTIQILTTNLNNFLEKVEAHGDETKLIEKELYITFGETVVVSQKAQRELGLMRFEKLGAICRKTFLKDPSQILLFVSQLKKVGFDRQQATHIVSHIYTTFLSSFSQSELSDDQKHVISVLYLVLYGVDNILNKTKTFSKTNFFPQSQERSVVHFEKMMNVIDVIRDNSVFGYDQNWWFEAYLKTLTFLLLQNDTDTFMKILKRNNKEVQQNIVEEILSNLILDNSGNGENRNFLMKLLAEEE